MIHYGQFLGVFIFYVALTVGSVYFRQPEAQEYQAAQLTSLKMTRDYGMRRARYQLPLLLEKISDPDPNVRYNVVLDLGIFCERFVDDQEDIVPHLRRAMRDVDFKVRTTAAIQLATRTRYLDEEVIELLKMGALDSDVKVRLEAVKAAVSAAQRSNLVNPAGAADLNLPETLLRIIRLAQDDANTAVSGLAIVGLKSLGLEYKVASPPKIVAAEPLSLPETDSNPVTALSPIAEEQRQKAIEERRALESKFWEQREVELNERIRQLNEAHKAEFERKNAAEDRREAEIKIEISNFLANNSERLADLEKHRQDEEIDRYLNLFKYHLERGEFPEASRALDLGEQRIELLELLAQQAP
jgi:hypothetical protein